MHVFVRKIPKHVFHIFADMLDTSKSIVYTGHCISGQFRDTHIFSASVTADAVCFNTLYKTISLVNNATGYILRFVNAGTWVLLVTP